MLVISLTFCCCCCRFADGSSSLSSSSFGSSSLTSLILFLFFDFSVTSVPGVVALAPEALDVVEVAVRISDGGVPSQSSRQRFWSSPMLHK